MKTLNFKRDSWYYKYVNIVTDVYDNTDICSFTRNFLLATIVYLILLGFASFIFVPIIVLIVELLLRYKLGSVGNIGIANLFILGTLGVLVGIIKLIKKYRSSSPKIDSPPSMISTMWTNFKQKTCVKINFINSDTLYEKEAELSQWNNEGGRNE
jgi:hypothetical protein